MKQYLELMKKCSTGTPKNDRTGTGTLSILATRCASICKKAFLW